MTSCTIRVMLAMFFAALVQIVHSTNATNRGSYNIRAHEALSEAAKIGAMDNLNIRGDLQNKDGLEALFIAAAKGDQREIERLIQEGVDVNGQKKNGWKTGWTALFYAAASGRDNSAVIELLLKHKANINAKDVNGRTALLAAMEPHDTRANIKALIDGGADVSVQDFGGDTPLIEAAGLGDAVVVKMLLEKGANPDAKQNQGRTALMTAAALSHAEVVKALLDGGADPHKIDNEGNTALALLERVIKEDRENNIGQNKYVRNNRAAIVRMLAKK